MSKLYRIKSNEQLFNEWMRVSASPHSKVGLDTWSIIQNNMEMTGDELNEWHLRTTELIYETEVHFQEVLEDMRKLQKRTVNYIKSLNK